MTSKPKPTASDTLIETLVDDGAEITLAEDGKLEVVVAGDDAPPLSLREQLTSPTFQAHVATIANVSHSNTRRVIDVLVQELGLNDTAGEA